MYKDRELGRRFVNMLYDRIEITIEPDLKIFRIIFVKAINDQEFLQSYYTRWQGQRLFQVCGTTFTFQTLSTFIDDSQALVHDTLGTF